MDIISKYKKNKLLKNIWIIVTSLFFAISLNYTLSNTEISNTIKSSVINSDYIKKEISDIYIKKEDLSVNDILTIHNSKKINWLKSLNITFVYNPENITIKDSYLSDNELNLIKINEQNWLLTLSIISENNKDINLDSNLVNLLLEKNTINIEHLNIINAFFTDKDNNTFELSTSWIDF